MEATATSAAGRSPRPQFWSIQLLRIVAAYGVVLSHFLMARNGNTSMMNGVDIFFLISGFLVWTISDRLAPPPMYFLAHRTARIVPLYWAVIALQVVLAAVVPAVFREVDALPPNVLLSALFIPHYDAHGRMWPFITQGWTLDLDVFYYLLFAAALALPKPRRLPFMTLALVGLAVLGALVRPWHNGVVTWTLTNPLAVAFAAGMWIAEAWLRGWLKGRRIGVLVVVLGACIYARQTTSVTAYAGPDIYAWVAASGCVLTGLLCIEGAGVRLHHPALSVVADWTYGVYLSHQLVRMLAAAWLPAAAPVQFLALLIGSTLLGKAGYDLVELPVNRAFRRLEKRYAPGVRRLATTPISPTAQLTDVAP